MAANRFALVTPVMIEAALLIATGALLALALTNLI